MKRTITVIIAFVCCLAAAAQDITGNWNGRISYGNSSLTIIFNVTQEENGSLSCTLDSPDQGVKGIPAAITVTDGTNVEISISALMATYEGVLQGDELKGSFKQAGTAFALDMKRGEEKLQRPQTPRQPYPYKTEEITFINTGDNTLLSGTLTYPVGFEQMPDGTVPVVVMVSGSGQQNRDEEIFGHKPFLVLADCLARNGIASLRYDDRGCGQSAGDASKVTGETNMEDASAAVDFVRQSGKFGKTGILGHSEGGAIAFMLGARDKAGFVISMAGPGVSGSKILLAQNKAILMQNGIPAQTADDYCKALKIALDTLSGSTAIDDPAATARKTVAQARVELPAPAVANLTEVLKGSTPWLRYFIAFDPSEDIRNTHCPVLAINGNKDMQVDAETNIGAIRELLPDNRHNLTIIYDGLNHLFQHCTTGNVTEYRQIEETISPEVAEQIASWINSVK